MWVSYVSKVLRRSVSRSVPADVWIEHRMAWHVELRSLSYPESDPGADSLERRGTLLSHTVSETRVLDRSIDERLPPKGRGGGPCMALGFVETLRSSTQHGLR